MEEEYLTDLPEERIAKYRLLAAQARNAAHNAKTSEISEAYMAVGTAWETMAVDLQHVEEFKERLFRMGHKPLARSSKRAAR
jgi:hypothetical protein